MHSKFFKEQEKKLLTYQIKALISQIEALKASTEPDELALRELALALEEHSKKESYRSIHYKTRQKAAYLLAGLEPANSQEDFEPPFTVQIPSDLDLSNMMGMKAGGTEDQSVRLTHMSQIIQAMQESYSSNTIVKTSAVELADHWTELFNYISQGLLVEALTLLRAIPKRDPILKALLGIHELSYLELLIDYSVKAHETGLFELNGDILITPYSFEILIKDLATTLSCPSKLCISFGLPTHHAFSDQAAGFCLFNKVAVLISHLESKRPNRMQYLVVGTDVNRDNGLSDIIMRKLNHLKINHYDVFDSEVYPFENFASVSQQLGAPHQEDQQSSHWLVGNAQYIAIDLSTTKRCTESIHPALRLILAGLKENVSQAVQDNEEVFLFLPTGWDSHQDETAYCGRYVNERRMSPSQAHRRRFSDDDLSYFYSEIFTLYHQNEAHIAGIYWGLEGGYERSMYESKLQSFLVSVNQHFMPQIHSPQYD